MTEALPATVLRRATATPDRVALRKKHLGRWRTYTWADYAARAGAVAGGLRELGVTAGDHVAIHSGNRPAWLFADLAAQSLGATTIGLDPDAPAGEVADLLQATKAKVVIAEDEEQVDKALEARTRLRGLARIVVIDARGVDLDDPLVLSFAGLEALGAGSALDAATTTAPSGAPTGGPAAGVGERTEVLSYLPLRHPAERSVSVADAVEEGFVVSFGEGGDTFLQDLREVQPTFFLAVPRVWEHLLDSVHARMADAGPLQRTAYRWSRAGGGGGGLTGAIGSALVHRPVRSKLGLARVTSAVSVEGPVDPEVLRWFTAIGVPIRVSLDEGSGS